MSLVSALGSGIETMSAFKAAAALLVSLVTRKLMSLLQ